MILVGHVVFRSVASMFCFLIAREAVYVMCLRHVRERFAVAEVMTFGMSLTVLLLPVYLVFPVSLAVALIAYPPDAYAPLQQSSR